MEVLKQTAIVLALGALAAAFLDLYAVWLFLMLAAIICAIFASY